MAAITVGGVSSSVVVDGIEHEFEEFGGSRKRMTDGSLRQTVKGKKNVWTLTTSFLSSGDADTLIAAIVTAPPLTCSGDVLGASFSCAGQVIEKERASIGGVMYYRVHFRLYEI